MHKKVVEKLQLGVRQYRLHGDAGNMQIGEENPSGCACNMNNLSLCWCHPWQNSIIHMFICPLLVIYFFFHIVQFPSPHHSRCVSNPSKFFQHVHNSSVYFSFHYSYVLICIYSTYHHEDVQMSLGKLHLCRKGLRLLFILITASSLERTKLHRCF